MSLDDKDLFTAIFSRFNDQPIEFVMEQYEKAKRMNHDIEKRLGANAVAEWQSANMPRELPEEQPEAPKQKKYTRRDLVCKPGEAITDAAIICCICGARRQSLTQRHLATHDISVEDYKKLCGYDPDTPLMSRMHHAKSRQIVARAQQARLAKAEKE